MSRSPQKKVRFIPEVAQAVQKEWDKLRHQKAWDLSTVREMYDVKAEYRQKGKVAHFGRVFPVCYKKHAEKEVHKDGNANANDDKAMLEEDGGRTCEDHGEPLQGDAAES